MIAAVVTAFERPALLRRLLTSLHASGDVSRTWIVNNSSQPLADGLASLAPGTTVIQAERNVGTGGGVARGLSAAFADPAVQHVLICDDDSVLAPGAPSALRATLAENGGGAGVPMILRANGTIGWFPGLLDRAKWRVIKRQPLLPAEYLARCGPAPVRFNWAPWPVLLVTREAVALAGLPREDLWYHGVDLEYTLRLTAHLPGYFVPAVRSEHLPPAGVLSSDAAHARECFGLQNQFFISSRTPHGRSLARHLAGNTWRVFASAPRKPQAALDALRAAWWGAGRGRPATTPRFDLFLQRWERARASR
jgi:hypothetical protein